MDLAYRSGKIQERRKRTSWREFVLNITPWICFGLYNGPCGISRYPITSRVGKVMKQSDYEKEFPEGAPGVVYNDNQSFFTNFQFFFLNAPKSVKTIYGTNENSEYAEVIFSAKNAYLSFIVGQEAENILYSIMVYDHVQDVYNSTNIIKSQNIYYSKSITESYNIFYCKFIHNSSNIWFSTNCVGCTECIFCNGLENQSYSIHNSVMHKDEYYKEKAKILREKYLFEDYFENISRAAINILAQNSTGTNIKFSKNIENGINVFQVENGRNLICADFGTYYYDAFDVGMESHHLYGVAGAGQHCEHIYCCANQSYSYHVYYSYFLEACSFCLGCIGLKNKSYCILNKQYTKEERYKKVDEIFAKMDADGILGVFFPATMNPFYFNDTAAYLIDPSFTKDEVTQLGYLWRDEAIHMDIPDFMEVVHVNDLASYESSENNNRYIDPAILKKVIRDEAGNSYRIVKMEYDFLVKYNLPLPSKHWLERMKENFSIG